MSVGNIVKAKVRIQGTRSLFFHWFGPNAIPLEKQEKTGAAGNDPSEWRRSTLVTQDGQLYITAPYVFGTLRNAAKFVKSGRKSLMSDVGATLQILDDVVLIDRYFPGFPNGKVFDINIAEEPPRDSSQLVYLDVRGAVNPSTKGRNIRYRIAASPGWSCEFGLMWDKTIVSRAQMESVLWHAGQLVGIGNARTIGMGRFQVASFEIEE